MRCEQAGFRKGRETIEQVFILRNIIEQSSLDRSRLWKILRHYGIPSEIADLIRAMYKGGCCNVIDNGKMSDWFDVKIGVRQGYVMSGFLLIVVVDWVMTNTLRNRRRGLRWKFTSIITQMTLHY